MDLKRVYHYSSRIFSVGEEHKQRIIKDVKGLEYPLKIVVDVEADVITVITNYPLKKKVQK